MSETWRSPGAFLKLQASVSENRKRTENALTFGDWEECNNKYRISVRTPNDVCEVSWRHIDRVILLVACRHRDCGLVAASNYGDKHCTMAGYVLRDLVLQINTVKFSSASK